MEMAKRTSRKVCDERFEGFRGMEYSQSGGRKRYCLYSAMQNMEE